VSKAPGKDLTHGGWSGHDHLDTRFSVQEQAWILPGRSPAVAGQAQVSWTPCIREPAREAAGRGRGMGHVRVTRNRCHDQLWRMVFYEPPHDRGHRPLTGWVIGPDPPP
jgi:hypothetical protein